MTSKRIALTGASGFVGANLAQRLVRDGHKLHLLLRPSHARWRLEAIEGEAQFHTVDFADRASLQRALAGIRPDWIFHLAAYGAYSFQADLQTIVQTNFNGTVNLLEAAMRVGFEVFVNTGSSSEYGFKDRAPTEDAVLDPNSLYAVTKAASTLLCRHLASARDLRIPTLRLYSVYGRLEDPSRLIPALVRRGLEGRFPPLAGPEIARDFVYVDDVCDAFVAAATSPMAEPGAVFNIGSGQQTRLHEVVALVRELLGIAQEPPWSTMPQRSWDTQTWVADVAKAREVLQWQATTDLRTGLQRTIDWYRDHLEDLAEERSAQAAEMTTSRPRDE